MRRFTALAVLSLIAIVGLPASARASSIAVGGLMHLSDGPGGNGGGEFYADVSAFDGVTDFITFCLQYTEEFYYGQDMWVGGITDHTMGGTPDPISAQTAFLYTQFYNGTLSNYAFSSPITFQGNSYNRVDTGSALQIAIWNLEDEIPEVGGVFTGLGANALADYYISLANSAVLSGTWAGIGDVRVLNLYASHPSDGVYVGDLQDQIFMGPTALVPEPGALSLLGLGLLVAARGIRRRHARRAAISRP